MLLSARLPGARCQQRNDIWIPGAALCQLAELLVDIVELQVFGVLIFDEIAEILGLSNATELFEHEGAESICAR